MNHNNDNNSDSSHDLCDIFRSLRFRVMMDPHVLSSLGRVIETAWHEERERTREGDTVTPHLIDLCTVLSWLKTLDHSKSC